mgnify:CR=1 FL=1
MRLINSSELLVFLLIGLPLARGFTIENCRSLFSQSLKVTCIRNTLPPSFFAEAFLKFQQKYSKYYSTIEEYDLRQAIFIDNYSKILAGNLSGSSFRQGLNRFSDMTEEEFSRSRLSNFREEADAAQGPFPGW